MIAAICARKYRPVRHRPTIRSRSRAVLGRSIDDGAQVVDLRLHCAHALDVCLALAFQFDDARSAGVEFGVQAVEIA
jgi:hypothetical protein